MTRNVRQPAKPPTANNAAANDTILLAQGTYAGGFTTAASGTASAHITYVSDTPYGAKVVGAGTASNQTGWWNQGNYVDIKGFEIDGSGSQATSRTRFSRPNTPRKASAMTSATGTLICVPARATAPSAYR